MHTTHTHPWNVDTDTARRLQQSLASAVISLDQLGQIHTVAGTDVGFEADGTITRAAVAVLSYPQLQLREYRVARRPTDFPYVPGYLSFRECPALLEALSQLATPPDLLLCDGQGIAHPRRFGIACHLGLLTDIPSIGVAKSILVGKHDEVGNNKGDWQPLVDKDEIIGAAVRTRANVKPVYVSVGHRISLPTAIDYVLACTTRYRLPETTRWADGIASRKQAFLKRLEQSQKST